MKLKRLKTKLKKFYAKKFYENIDKLKSKEYNELKVSELKVINNLKH